jgi:hypothetical protein
MPLPSPILDARRYQELFDEVLSRIPVHTPEWTNFNASDPGVTLAALFAFLTENSLHLLNRAPENLRSRFLERLELGLAPGAGAEALVSFSNDRGPLEAITLDAELEVRAEDVPFRTQRPLDVLPIEARAFYKRKVAAPDPQLKAYYKSLFTSFLESDGSEFGDDAEMVLYETVELPAPTGTGVDLSLDSVDRTLWIALLIPTTRKPPSDTEPGREALRAEVRDKLDGRVLSLGFVPVLDAKEGKVLAAGTAAAESAAGAADAQVVIETPMVPADGDLGLTDRVPRYRTLLKVPVPTAPTVLDVPLPNAAGLRYWGDLDPLEPGADEFPPALEDSTLENRRLTWLRIRFPEGAAARVLWCGVNTVPAVQRNRVTGEVLPPGTGRPDQTATLARKPVVPGTVRLTVSTNDGTRVWEEVGDLARAAPEVPARDPEQPPGMLWEIPTKAEVFALDAETGRLRFGDGLRGRRPPAGASLAASYDYSVGARGNVRADAIQSAPSLPPGFKVRNPVPTWGGADAETPEEGQKHVARFLQHRERLVTEEDFRIIPRRAPGLEIGRIEVLPLYDARLGEATEPGAAPGVVTLIVIPKRDPNHPRAPLPGADFLQALCRYLEPRRLLTTEVVLKPPTYVDIWVSVGIGIASTQATAVVKRAVEESLHVYLSPLPPEDLGIPELSPLLTAPDPNAGGAEGWPWRKAVTRGELVAAVARVSGVVSVVGVKLSTTEGAETEQVPMGPLNFPRLAGLSVVTGPPLDIDQIRGTTSSSGGPDGGGGPRKPPRVVPVPTVPKNC